MICPVCGHFDISMPRTTNREKRTNRRPHQNEPRQVSSSYFLPSWHRCRPPPWPSEGRCQLAELAPPFPHAAFPHPPRECSWLPRRKRNENKAKPENRRRCMVRHARSNAFLRVLLCTSLDGGQHDHTEILVVLVAVSWLPNQPAAS